MLPLGPIDGVFREADCWFTFSRRIDSHSGRTAFSQGISGFHRIYPSDFKHILKPILFLFFLREDWQRLQWRQCNIWRTGKTFGAILLRKTKVPPCGTLQKRYICPKIWRWRLVLVSMSIKWGNFGKYRGVAVGVHLLAHLSDGLSAVLHQHGHQPRMDGASGYSL